ncbi:MAG TPA: saccharopine dehydrogenase C-terminal domain-containing protein [Actinomycetota bacterium]|nr:saccharopine dehydrogenase C-terminal domain-containing protein [Actinomycetota bacterium]
MRIAVLGAGAMGSAAARLLARRTDTEILVLDADEERARGVTADVGLGEARSVDLRDTSASNALMGADAVAVCVPYRLNLEAMELAVAARVPYADLGGLYHMTLRQLELDARFREAGVPAVLGVGCCPGISNVFARLGAERLDDVRSVDLLDGSIERDAGFGVPYSADTILDEFVAAAMVFEGGELKEVPAGSGAVRFRFPDPLGEMEAVYTLHSELATLPRTIRGVRDVRWRLALPPKVADGFRLLVDLGLASEDPIDTTAGPVVPRELLHRLLARVPQPDGPPRDVEVLVAIVRGVKEGRPATFSAWATFRPTPEGISAGAFGTAIPIVVAARWLAEGRIPPGVHPPESVLDPDAFLEDLAREGVELRLELEERLTG